MDTMDYDGKFAEYMETEFLNYKAVVELQKTKLNQLFPGKRQILVVNDPNNDFDIHETSWLTDVYHRTPTHRLIWLGLLINRKLRPEDNLSLITDPDLIALVEYSPAWYPFALRINQALDDGLNLNGNVEECSFDSRFINNIKFPRPENDFLGFKFIIEADTFVLLKDDLGIEKPDVIRCWLIDTIPEEVEIGGEIFKLRDEMVRRVADEAPLYAFCDIVKYCLTEVDFNNTVIKQWLNYFVRKRDFFRFNGKDMVCSSSLIAHKRFEVALSHQRCHSKFTKLDEEGFECLTEGALYIMPDPIFRSHMLRSPFGDLNQHVFARTVGPSIVWSRSDIESTNFTLSLEPVPVDYSQDRFNYVDSENTREVVEGLRMMGMPKNARLLHNLQTANINPTNMLKGKVNRMILAMCGYTGTHAATALVNQFKGTSDMGEAVTDTFATRVADNMFDYINIGFAKDGIKDISATPDILFKGGTSSASSTNTFKSISGPVKYYSPFLMDEDVDNKTVFDTSGPKKLVLTRISHKLRSKNANIITNPENFLNFNADALDEVVNAGSRLVRGTRAKRIITPNYGSIYANSLCTVLPAVRLLSNRPKNTLASTLEGIVGTTYTGALPHDVMAPFMCATTNDPSYFAAAFDFAQFDSSQYGRISDAHADGVRRFADKFTGDDVNDAKGRLDFMSLRSKFIIQSESYRRPLKYKSKGIIAEASGVKSGELTTQLRNTATNKGHTDEVLIKFNQLSRRKIRIKSENIIGDDKNIVFSLEDGRPLDSTTAKLLIEVARDVAQENHMELSAKRTVVGNCVTEHIKIFVARGFIMQDVFLDSFASEKNSLRAMSYADRLNTIYDIFMTMLIRFAQAKPLMDLMVNDMCLMDGLKSGRVTFIPTLGTLFAIGGPEMLVGAPEIRGMARFMHRFDNEYFSVMNDLYATLRDNSGGKKFIDDLTGSATDDLVNDFWVKHFKRKNDYDVSLDTRITNKRQLQNLIPENCRVRLLKMVLDTVKEPVIQIMNDTMSLVNIIQRGKLTKYSKPKYHYVNWFIRPYNGVKYVSPYLAADDGVRNVHTVVGLAERNTSIPESVEPINRLLRKYPHMHPSYIGGIDILSALSEVDSGMWRDCLLALDFREDIIQPLLVLVDNVMFRYLHERNVTSTSLYDNTSRTYDVSDSNLNKLVHVAPSNSNKQSLGWRFEGMKVVLYMARYGHMVSVSHEPLVVDGDTVNASYITAL
ncbi:VP1 [Liao ning virus]|uniref:RNA-directed RNA polymerase n=1 Tax=Liao ning virus TaxID=246280 RepID=Q2TV19_9REOV|nr:VP1 [Liao ning virus]